MEKVNESLRAEAKRGHEAEVEAWLLDLRCDVRSKDVHGFTALMRAASNGHAGCVRLLLLGSDAWAANYWGTTALMRSAGCGNADVVPGGATALMQAARYGHLDCVQLLLSVSELGAQDEVGETASEQARRNQHFKIADLIDASALARCERSALSASTAPGASRQVFNRRV